MSDWFNNRFCVWNFKGASTLPTLDLLQYEPVCADTDESLSSPWAGEHSFARRINLDSTQLSHLSNGCSKRKRLPHCIALLLVSCPFLGREMRTTTKPRPMVSSATFSSIHSHVPSCQVVSQTVGKIVDLASYVIRGFEGW